MNIFKYLRLANNLTQLELAKYLSCSKSNYSHIENNGTSIIDTYILISYLYDINVYYLLEYTKTLTHLTQEEKDNIKKKCHIDDYLKEKIGEVNYDIRKS